MYQEIVLAGMGGQGVMVIGQLLAHAALIEDLNVVWFPSYGAETRGGSAECTVTISDKEIGSPVTSTPDYLIALTQIMLDKFVATVKPGGTIFVNTSLAAVPTSRPDCTIIEVKATDIAEQVGSMMAANMVMLGAFIGLAKPVKLESVKQAMLEVLPERHHKFIPINSAGLDRGSELTNKIAVM